MILITERVTKHEQNLIEMLKLMDSKSEMYVMTEDLLCERLDDYCNKNKKSLYYAFLETPEYWSIHANGINGAVYDGSNKKADIFFNDPVERRNVSRVEWHDDEEKVYRIDYYNKYGHKSCVENICDGNVISREYLDSDNNIRLIEQVTTGTYTLFEDGRIKSCYYIFTELLRSELVSRGINDINIWITNIDILRKFDNDYGKFHITYILNEESDFIKFKESFIKKDIRVLCNNESWIQWITDNTECSCGRFYRFENRKKSKFNNKEAFILTETDQIEYIENLIQDFPQIKYNIAASTIMSDKLNGLDKYENVSLYPCISVQNIKKLFDTCSIYLDINFFREIHDAVNRACINDLIILSFDNTVHRRDICIEESIVDNTDYMRMHDLIEKVVSDENIYDDILEKQRLKLQNLVKNMIGDEAVNEGF